MSGLERVAARLVKSYVVGEIWVDGSFLTERIDPSDADIVLHCGHGIYDEGYPEQKEAIDWIISNLKTEHFCDSYVCWKYESNDPLFQEGEFDRALYMTKFGFKDGGDEGAYKGIAVIELPGGVK